MFGYKAPGILKNKAYVVYTLLTKDVSNAVDGHFSSACDLKKEISP